MNHVTLLANFHLPYAPGLEVTSSISAGAETTVSFHSGYCFGLLLSVHAISSQLGVSVTDSKLKGWGHLIQKTVDLIVFTIKCMLCCY